MTDLTFPLSLSWEQIAELPGAADAFGWDDSQIDPEFEPDLAARINAYNDCLKPQLATYLANIGYTVGDTGIIIRNVMALETAHTLFNQILFEYDDEAAVRVPVVLYGHETFSTPTWAMFHLSGDDDVDYNGSQPSCLTDLFVTLLQAQANA
jgi:hypothetical protein